MSDNDFHISIIAGMRDSRAGMADSVPLRLRSGSLDGAMSAIVCFCDVGQLFASYSVDKFVGRLSLKEIASFCCCCRLLCVINVVVIAFRPISS